MHGREERSRWPRADALAVVATLIVGLASDALAEPDAASGWVPGFELGLDAQFDDRGASVSGNVAPATSGRDTNSIAVVRFGGELLAPKLTDRWGGPRPFIRLGGQLTLADKEVASSGDPAEGAAFALLAGAVEQQNRIDDGLGQVPGSLLLSDLDPDDIEGEGSYVRIRQNVRPTWYASLGAAWQMESPVHDGWLRIKPSIEYVADEFRYDGYFADVIESSPEVFELTTQRANRRVREHRLGPGLELELLLARAEPAMVSLFFSTRLLFLVSGRFNAWGEGSTITTTVFDDLNDVQGVPSTGKTTRFTAESERFLVRFGGGVRIAFDGL